MESVGSVVTFSEKVQTSQPSLTKRGLALQNGSGNSASGAEKAVTQEFTTSPETSPEKAIDLRV